MIVIDASVLYEALLGSVAASDRLSEERLFAPELVDVEFMNSLRKSIRRKIITKRRADEALENYAETYIVRFPMRQFMDRAWELRDNVTPYDAMYVALAEWFEVPLVTTDAKLAGASGIKASVEVVPVG
ncbi:MAG TPA: type II toxin-antitoxin system VapC family toxin [Acidimicrobiales bacterium]|nr:type II toxin-antitoxin system VapC family toxin [Acidimicrobiales bacterium]